MSKEKFKDFSTQELSAEFDRRAKDDGDDREELRELVDAWADDFGYVEPEDNEIAPALYRLDDWSRDDLTRAVSAADLPRVLEVLERAEIA